MTPLLQSSKLWSSALEQPDDDLVAHLHMTCQDMAHSPLTSFLAPIIAGLRVCKKLHSPRIDDRQSESASRSVWSPTTGLATARQARKLTQLPRHHSVAKKLRHFATEKLNVPTYLHTLTKWPIISSFPIQRCRVGSKMIHTQQMSKIRFHSIGMKGTMALIIWANVGPVKTVAFQDKILYIAI